MLQYCPDEIVRNVKKNHSKEGKPVITAGKTGVEAYSVVRC
jgi:hypothetical protein